MMELAPLVQEDGPIFEIDPWPILLIMAIWVSSILAAGYIAHESGRLPVKWTFWSLLTGPLAVVVLLLSIRLERR